MLVVFDISVCLPLKSSPDPPCELYRFDLELVRIDPLEASLSGV